MSLALKTINDELPTGGASNVSGGGVNTCVRRVFSLESTDHVPPLGTEGAPEEDRARGMLQFVFYRAESNFYR